MDQFLNKQSIYTNIAYLVIVTRIIVYFDF